MILGAMRVAGPGIVRDQDELRNLAVVTMLRLIAGVKKSCQSGDELLRLDTGDGVTLGKATEIGRAVHAWRRSDPMGCLQTRSRQDRRRGRSRERYPSRLPSRTLRHSDILPIVRAPSSKRP
jgi:hypothetical protein